MYYDNPKILNNWIYRLLYLSDYQKYKHKSKIIIADSGTPEYKIEETIDVIKKIPALNTTYLRVEGEHIRNKVPDNLEARLYCHAANAAILDYSSADLIYTSGIGHIFTPNYFEKTLAIHIKNERACVLPARFDLNYSEYHSKDYDKSFEQISQYLVPGGGWPDMSMRRKWFEEIGGYDENYTTIGPVDMDMGSRLTGKLDNGAPSEMLFSNKGPYNNLGLDFIQPFEHNQILSVTCNQYPGHRKKDDSKRALGYEIGTKYYLENWGKIRRNENRLPIKYNIIKIF